MGNLIQVQYDMVKEKLPDAMCCTNLYGENNGAVSAEIPEAAG